MLNLRFLKIIDHITSSIKVFLLYYLVQINTNDMTYSQIIDIILSYFYYIYSNCFYFSYLVYIIFIF